MAEHEHGAPADAQANGDRAPDRPGRLGWRALGAITLTVIGVVGGIASIIGLNFLNVCSYVTVLCGPPPTVTITHPKNGDTVRFIDTVEGTVTGLRPGETVWVFITDEGGVVYHPQVGPSEVSQAGYWVRIGVRFGVDEDSGRGKQYRISIAVADRSGTATLMKYIDDGVRLNDFDGYHQLPQGVRVQAHSVLVRR